MASQHGSHFAAPVYSQNFPPNTYNVNSGMDRPPRPQFQRHSSPASGSFSSHETFIPGFQNRPQFSNYSGAGSFLNNPPPISLSPGAHPPPSAPAPACSPFSPNRPPFPSHPPPPRPPFSSQPSAPPHSPFPSQPPAPSYSQFPSQHPTPSQSPAPSYSQFPSQHPTPSQSPAPSYSQFPSQHPTPSQSPAASHPPFPSQLPPSQSAAPSHPPFHSQNPVSSHSQFSACPPPSISHHSPLPSHPPPPLSQPHFSSQRPFSPLEAPPQHNKFSNLTNPTQHKFLNVSNHAQHNKLPNMSHPPQQNQFPPMFRQQHQGFRFNSPSYAPRSRFDNSFQRPYRPWNQVTRFSGPKTPFSNQSTNIVKTHQLNDTSQQINKKKPKNREFRKIKSWMTDELFAEVKKKNALYLKAKSSDEQTAWQEFRLQRNRVSSLIKEAKIKAGLITRKVKEEDSTEKPFSCDTCDRAFVTENELNEHISQHIKCDYENCTFEAHFKIVLLHQKMQHETGYADRINKLKDDAEVKKWREERRKRFPTAENIRKRQAEQAEREARGEVLETKEFGKFKRRREENGSFANSRGKRMRFQRNRRNHFRRDFNQHHPGLQNFKVNSESDSDSDSHISLNGFSGLSSLANSAEEMCNANETDFSEQNLPNPNSDIDENHLIVSHSENNLTDEKTHSPTQSNAEKPKDCNSNGPSSSARCINQSFTSSESDARPANESVLEIPENEIEKPTKEIIDIEDSDDEGPEVIAIVKHKKDVDVNEREETNGSDATNVSNMNSKEINKEDEIRPNANDAPNTLKRNREGDNEGNEPKRQRTRKDSKFNGFVTEQDTANKTRKSSLLEKLLADDIRHERNVILQCIRHIVNNNFFGLSVKK